ncbi:RagB/SusD family nutrient uptake outer membrane protein [Pedobacter sp. MC2016-15]|uniref:RagB/SusD family nutrient uptake outer membrane protein n=1 Tax=Pedobacter sp. MC2016-15 TaxID=2994473 RepID=UPI00224547D5|nr:RagB/SusD family nutrient uptake outer membrane protein [Pedobacter sp. MC2016-15]MCX2480641.1 RagB/SusD family nutrient uptake outer membrane protein [Pedobacter sp. MC2016-15]
MNTSKIKYILIFLASLTVSCQKEYLNTDPEYLQNAKNFFKTKEDFVQAVNGAYAPLRPVFTDSFWQLGEMRSDNTAFQYNTGDRSALGREQIDQFLELDDNSFVYSFFSNSFIGIGRCNVIINRYAPDKINDENAAKQIIGQASFLRAYYYFNLVQLFGELPLVLSEISSTSDAFAQAKRRPVNEVYDAIIKDAKMAIENLPQRYTSANDLGRVTSVAARMLLAKVYMVQKQFNPAMEQLNLILQSGRALNANYSDNFNSTAKNSVESIFEVQFLEGPYSMSSNFMYTFAPYNAGTSITGFALYTGADSGWNIPTADLIAQYEAGDQRLDKSISRTFTDPVTRQVVPYIIKYKSPHAVRYQTNDNFPVYRFADALLMAAESLNEIGYVTGGQAFELLNRVRSRAGLPALTAQNVTTQEAFRTAVWHERQIELAFENHRWLDLLRTGQAENVMKAHAVREKASKSFIPAAGYSTIRPLFQYPRREVLLLE